MKTKASRWCGNGPAPRQMPNDIKYYGFVTSWIIPTSMYKETKDIFSWPNRLRRNYNQEVAIRFLYSLYLQIQSIIYQLIGFSISNNFDHHHDNLTWHVTKNRGYSYFCNNKAAQIQVALGFSWNFGGNHVDVEECMWQQAGNCKRVFCGKSEWYFNSRLLSYLKTVL